MLPKNYRSAMGNIRTKIGTFTKQGIEVLFSAIFITGKNKEKLMDHAPVEHLALVTKNLQCEVPDRIRIELYDSKDNPNNMWFKDIVFKIDEPQNETSTETEPITSFKGLGEAEITQLVDQKFRERQRNVDYEQLKLDAHELLVENQELQDTIEELESKNAELETELESKKQVRYYAGMLGDILESFGIAKDKLKKPIVELMGIDDGNKSEKQIESAKEDNSGIVQDKSTSAEEQKRNEIITLISDYLRTTGNQTLANIFNIFSEIEQDNAIAEQIIEFLNAKKQPKS